MVFIIHVASNYTENAVHLLEKLVELPDVRVGLICQEPLEWLKPELRHRFAAYHRVDNVFDTGQLCRAAKAMAEHQGEIHRILSATEQLQLAVAEVREILGINGMVSETIRNFRDKSRMKNKMREAGLPCAKHFLAACNEDAVNFSEVAGFPLVIKPPEGVASQATYKVGNVEDLNDVLFRHPPMPGNELLLEEFITGDEFSFDTFTLDGEPLFHSLTHYDPNPLTAMREPWIQWQVLLPREIDDEYYDDIRESAFKTLKTLRMGTGMSHLEWFRRADGTIAISEVAARPPGAQIMKLLSRANDFDSETAWARLMIFGEWPKIERKYAVGAAFLRGMGEGRVLAVNGLEEIQKEVGHLITDVRIPKIGQEKSLSYEGEGYIILRHPETAVVKEALLKVVSTVRVVLGY